LSAWARRGRRSVRVDETFILTKVTGLLDPEKEEEEKILMQ
jgi:hypothetical protein